MIRRLGPIALIGALILTACGGGGESTTVEGQNVTVLMFDNRYEYTEIRIPPGGTVNFVGGGRNPHNAVANDESWSTEDAFGSLEQYEGDEATVAFDTAGEYPFFCTFHGNSEGAGMVGTVIVEAAG